MCSDQPTTRGAEGGDQPERMTRWQRREHLRTLEAIVYDGWDVPRDVFVTIPHSLLEIAVDTMQSTRDRIRATEALAHLVQHRTEAAVQLDRILRLDAGQATDRVQMLASLSDAQMDAVAASLAAFAAPPTPEPDAESKTTTKPKRSGRRRA